MVALEGEWGGMGGEKEGRWGSRVGERDVVSAINFENILVWSKGVEEMRCMKFPFSRSIQVIQHTLLNFFLAESTSGCRLQPSLLQWNRRGSPALVPRKLSPD